MWKTNNFDGEKIWYSEEEYQELQQENEELSYELDRKKDEIIYLKNVDMLHKIFMEYKQALNTIKKLSDKIINSDELYLWEVYELNEQISDKIKEVLND